MDGLYFTSLIIALLIHKIGCFYYHEPSRILLQSADHQSHNETEFGFSIEYQKGSSPKLLIGAPRHELDGKVYTCKIEDCLKKDKLSCSSVDINIQELANTNRSINPNQHFYLGASIAAAEDYFLTCAPLWTSDSIADKVSAGVYGTCFVYNGTAHRYNGLVEKGINAGNYMDHKWSSYGWNVLADEVNGFLLITKPVVIGDILTLPYNNPLEEINSLSRNNIRVKRLFDKTHNLGYGLVAGKFFGNDTTYAFTFTNKGNNGYIRFLKLKNSQTELVAAVVKRKEFGSMFGTSLCSCDIDQNGYSELIVSAPAQIDMIEEKEVGAVHIYSMINENMEIGTYFKGTILGVKEGGRFGTAIVADDVDADKIPEIFISAPYEENNGAVYIVSGAEINNIMFKNDNKFIHLPDLRHTQRIAGEGHRRFGFSIKIVPDIDENGCNELAVGSPGDSYVSLYRCLNNVHVEMNTTIVGPKIVSEKTDKFEVSVCVNLTYQEKPTNIISKLLVTNKIIGERALIPNPNFTIDMAKKEPLVCKDITVTLSNHDPSNYQFTTELDLHPETYDMLKEKDFKNSWAILSPFSTRSKNLDISRRCSGNECLSILSMNVTWIGENPYLLGSRDVATIQINVQNMGSNSYTSCVWINLEGARVGRLDCPRDEANTGYICPMIKPLQMYKNASIIISPSDNGRILKCQLESYNQHVVSVLLNMSRPMNTDKQLDVDVKLYDDCENRQKPVEQKNITILYYSTADYVSITGLSAVRNVSDKELNNVKMAIFNDNHEYSIVNAGKVYWLGVQISIKMKMHTFIINYKVSAPDMDNCTRHNYDGFVEFNCTCNLKPGVIKKFMAVAFVSKERLKDLFKEIDVSTSSEAYLALPSVKILKKDTTEYFHILKHSITTKINFKKELTVGDNKLMIIVIGILLALLLLMIIAIVLYKCNFFQRKQKKKLDELRDSWRRKAIRERTRTPSNPGNGYERQSKVDELEYLEMEVMEDPFEEVPIASNDGKHLIEEKAQVHCSS